MRILIVDHYYDAVTRSIYERNPGLSDRTYANQRAVVDDELFGQSPFQVAALRALGHEARDCQVNIYPLQRAFCREDGEILRDQSRWGIRLRRGWLPWPRRRDNSWMIDGLLAQVRAFEPDVVHIQSMDLLPPEAIALVKDEVRLVVGQIAADTPPDWDYRSYDLVLSSVPTLVDRFRREVGHADWLPLAFEPALVEEFAGRPRDIPVSFVGSLSISHPRRIEVLESVARHVPLQTWTGDVASLMADSPVRAGLRGTAWGRPMYEILARSRITVNNHARIAVGAANNLRLFEATGMGALLVTEEAANLGDLFEPGREVVTYRSPQEAGEVVRYYVDHPDEAAQIAQAGRERTLRDHTWLKVMARWVELVEPYL